LKRRLPQTSTPVVDRPDKLCKKTWRLARGFFILGPQDLMTCRMGGGKTYGTLPRDARVPTLDCGLDL
jgi:hypothetical protein